MKTTLCTIALVVVVAGACGCQRKLAPEMDGLALTDDEAHAHWRVTKNQYWRSASDDLSRTFYTNSASRLTPYPIVATSGQPR